MQKEVTLHGGPLHGKKIVIPADWGAFKVAQLEEDYLTFRHDPEKEPVEVTIREGVYSSVHFSPKDFEWDGWKNERQAPTPADPQL